MMFLNHRRKLLDCFLLRFEVLRHVAVLLFQLMEIELICIDVLLSLDKKAQEVFRYLVSPERQLCDSLLNDLAFDDGHNNPCAVPNLYHETCGAARSVKRHEGSIGDEDRMCVEALKQHRSHLLPVGKRGLHAFGDHQRALVEFHTKFIVDGVVPQRFKVVPIFDLAVLHRVLYFQHSPFARIKQVFSEVRLLGVHANHMRGETPDQTHQLVAGRVGIPESSS
mmetsp:Transcript_17518/g.27082  ORF Transcript_17518/g.27082 Transcript_17518/m.27082 type:complete len:223 (+) Transcript_17518:633-1301(+)